MKVTIPRFLCLLIFGFIIFLIKFVVIDITVQYGDTYSYTKSILAMIFDEDGDFRKGKEIMNSSKEITYKSCLKTYETKTYHLPQWMLQPKECDARVSVVLLIKSSIFRNTLRHTLRKTWAQEISTYFGTVKRIFLMGSAPPNQIVPLIEKESSDENDILQGNFEDTYHSVTRKVLMGMHFVKTLCPQVNKIIVADDDAVILPWNLHPIFDKIATNNSNNLDFGGFAVDQAIPRRDKNDRWYVAPADFNCTYYPTYPSGTMYFLSQNTLKVFHYLSQVVSLFAWEDVYLGVLAKIGNISLTRLPLDMMSHDCVKLFTSHSIQSFNNLIACHGTDEATDLVKVWSEFCYSATSSNKVKQIILNYCSHFLLQK